jgi:hypothetical protein
MEPIRRIGPYESTVAAVARVADSRVREETPEEAHERRQREARERRRKQAARAWADAQLVRVQEQHEQVVVSEDDSDDGHPHVDIRV